MGSKRSISFIVFGILFLTVEIALSLWLLLQDDLLIPTWFFWLPAVAGIAATFWFFFMAKLDD